MATASQNPQPRREVCSSVGGENWKSVASTDEPNAIRPYRGMSVGQRSMSVELQKTELERDCQPKSTSSWVGWRKYQIIRLLGDPRVFLVYKTVFIFFRVFFFFIERR